MTPNVSLTVKFENRAKVLKSTSKIDLKKKRNCTKTTLKEVHCPQMRIPEPMSVFPAHLFQQQTLCSKQASLV